MYEWYCIVFKMSPPRPFIDLIIIDLLFTPTIKKFKSDITLWRLHRSWKPEEQELKLFLYITPDKKDQILNSITSDESYGLIKNNYLKDDIRIEGAGGSNIEATSDPVWPLEIQKAWPYYIKGVSEMFINLIEEIKRSKLDEVDKSSLIELEKYYQELDKEIAAQWSSFGCHSFLHHLSAVFGYKSMVLQAQVFDQNSEKWLPCSVAALL